MKTFRPLAAAAALLCTLGAAGSAHALEYKSIGAAPAVLYDAPSEKGRRVFVAPRNMPVEVILTYGDWTKIRDAAGDLSWVSSKALSPARYLVVTAPLAKVHAAADDASPMVFAAAKGVLLELAEPVSGGWIRVHHRDGATGFVRAADVWGD